jgi:hypothetical protein
VSFLMRGRSAWFGRDQIHPRAAEPTPEPVSNVTVLPVAAPAPEGVTDDLSPSSQLNRLATQRLEERLACVAGLTVEPVGRETLLDGTPADKQWVAGELLRLERLAVLTKKHGPWEAAQCLWTPGLTPSTTSSANATYRITLRGQR